MKGEISIIIPVFNEESTIVETVEKLKSALIDEVIIVDGGSSDRTIETAEATGCNVIRSEKKGRAAQMNTGAGHASAPILYFLHSDTQPPENFAEVIVEAARTGADYGCFALQFDDTQPVLKFFSLFTRLKTKWVRFGDQSLFVKKEIFERISGFDESLILMEDQEIYHRLEAAGKFRLLDGKVITSSRRYREIGVLKLQFFFTLIYLGYYLGVSHKTLLKFYTNHIRTE